MTNLLNGETNENSSEQMSLDEFLTPEDWGERKYVKTDGLPFVDGGVSSTDSIRAGDPMGFTPFPRTPKDPDLIEESRFVGELTELLTKYKLTEDEIDGVSESLRLTMSDLKVKEIRRDNSLIHAVFNELAKLQYRKEGSYGDSWAKRGELEVFFNISRKFDRLENIMLNGAQDEVGESYVDTIADGANYFLLWMTFIAREKPELYRKWVESMKTEGV